jgi:hypothetical protein
MKLSRSWILSLLALSMGITAGFTAQAAPTTYPLKCRGTKSGELQFHFSATTAMLGFKKAAHAAPAGLNPGECAWMDRALNADEPALIVQYPQPSRSMFNNTSIFFGSLNGGGQVVAPVIGVTEPEIGWLKDLMNADNYWLFQVYNDSDGHLIATTAQAARP